MAKQKDKYLFDLSNTLMGQIGFSLEKIRENPSSPLFPSALWDEYALDIQKKIEENWSEVKIAEIATYGKGDECKEGSCRLSQVHFRNRNWLDGNQSGKRIVMLLAVTTLVAAIVDRIRRDQRKLATAGKLNDPNSTTERSPSLSSLDVSLGDPGHQVLPKPGLDIYDSQE